MRSNKIHNEDLFTHAANTNFKKHIKTQSKKALEIIKAQVAWDALSKPLAEKIEQSKQPKSPAGRSAFSLVTIIRCFILQRIYNLSDPRLEEEIADRRSFQMFLDLTSADSIPDETTICRYRELFARLGLDKELFRLYKQQLKAAGLIIGKGATDLLQLELTAMQNEGRGEIVSTPRVITTDQQQATIKQGVEIPYEEATSSGATNVTFQEAVLELSVTPSITPDNKVIMELDISKDNPDFGREVRGVPPIDTRSLETTVRVDDGETVVLGGIFESETATSEDKVPVLGDIPAFGRLFRRDAEIAAKRELLLFVTPNILDD